ncbi:metallophosphoesterase [Archangium sp.]|uniref:metallophosphoesterase n=1 Tax=Archangium sp. TaxID=1872627 RepID=UPI003899D0BC
MSRLSWLHLSDLLMGPKGSRWLWPEYREDFERDLRAMHDQTGPWDLVLISGDLTDTGSQREFNLLDSALKSFWASLRGLGSDPILLAVPGNHDLHQPSLPAKTRERLSARRWHERDQERNDFWNEPESAMVMAARTASLSSARERSDLWSEPDNALARSTRMSFLAFSSWLTTWQIHRPQGLELQLSKGFLPGDFAATVAKDGLRVGIAGMNSAFLLAEADGSRGPFDVDARQLQTATGGSLSGWARSHDLTLLLTHHPPSRLHSERLLPLQRELASSTRGLLHLCGSQHESESPPEMKPLPFSWVYQAPSLFGGAPGSRKQGYAVGVLDLSGPSPHVRLFTRESKVSSHSGQAGLTSGGQLQLPLPKAPGQTPPRAAPPAELRRTPEPTRTPAPAAVPAPAPVRPQAPPAPLPPGLRARPLLDTAQEVVTALAWAPSGRELVLGFDSGKVCSWELEAQEPRWTVQAHQTSILEVRISPDGRRIATRSALNLRLWSVEESETSLLLIGPTTNTSVCLAWSPQGVLAASFTDENTHFWQARDELRWNPATYKASTLTNCLAWSPDGRTLACGGKWLGRLTLLDVREDSGLHFQERLNLQVNVSPIQALAWQPGTSWLAVASDKLVRIIDPANPRRKLVLEGHTDTVVSVAFSHDGRLLASRSQHGTIHLHRTDTWDTVAVLGSPFESDDAPKRLAFSPTDNVLASISPGGYGVKLWDLDVDTLLGQREPPRTVHTVSAKVVLVGEGRAGKSCLAQRLVEDRYEEQDPTHAMRTWSLPLERLDPKAHVPDNERRDIVLWDMGGQSEYRLVHQLFFRDTSAALLVMEPARGQAARDEIEGWNQRLSAQLGGSPRKLLVGSKVDNEWVPVDRPAIEQLLRQCGLEPDAYVSTSAKSGRGLSELKAQLARAIDWDNVGRSSHPELFERIRQHLLRLRESGRVVLSLPDLERELRASHPELADPEALRTVVQQLGRRGVLADTRLADGTQALVLDIEQVERYASSLIVAARENPNRVPAVDMAAFSRAPTLPRIRPEQRLPRDQELVVLDCVIELLLQHGLCLRHQGLLIFPSLFLLSPSEPGAEAAVPSRAYAISGPVDNIYASLVTAIALSRGFGPMRLWEDRAEFGEEPGQDSCGVRKVQRSEQQARGVARLEVYFDAGTPETTRRLFLSYVDTHLREQGVEFVEQRSVSCRGCGHVFQERTIHKRLADGHADVLCPECEIRTPLSPPAREPELLEKTWVLRTGMKDERSRIVSETKVSMTEAHGPDAPLRILHLSDLHVDAGADPVSLLQPLIADLTDPSDLAVDQLDYLVISGDLTNRADPAEFKKVLELVSALRERFSLTAERCIIVPGNHDLDWKTRVYEWHSQLELDVRGLPAGSYKQQGEGHLVRLDAKYTERFRNFSQHFHHPLLQREYPLDPEQQCISLFSPDTRLQFLALNSSWEVDQWFPERSHLHEGALSRGLLEARRQLEQARATGQLPSDAPVLKLAVWHHPITGNEKMQRDAFLARLQQDGVRLVLHGHVHEQRADLVGYTDPSKQVHVIGAGSFGAPTHHRPESVPRLYNLLEVARDHSRVRVHTRALRKAEGAWEGWAVWPGATKSERRTWYELALR